MPEPDHVGTCILDFPISGTVRKPISVVQAIQSMVLCQDRPSRLIQFLKENMGCTGEEPVQGLTQLPSTFSLLSLSPPLPTLPTSALFPQVVRDNTTTVNPSPFGNRDPRKTRALFQAFQLGKSQDLPGKGCGAPSPHHMHPLEPILSQ